MNQHAKVAGSTVTTISRDQISPAEWEARVDLAAVYRLTAHYGWDDVIYNHSSMRVPGEPRNFLMKKHELLYTEVTASNLVKVNMDEDLDEKSGSARLHAARRRAGRAAGRQLRGARTHRKRRGASGLKHGLRMVCQQALRFYQRVGYHKYEGITEDFDERGASTRRSGRTAR